MARISTGWKIAMGATAAVLLYPPARLYAALLLARIFPGLELHGADKSTVAVAPKG